MKADELALKLFNKSLTVSWEGSVVIVLFNRPTSPVDSVEIDLSQETVTASVCGHKFTSKAVIANEAQAKQAISDILESAIHHYNTVCKRIKKSIEDIGE